MLQFYQKNCLLAPVYSAAGCRGDMFKAAEVDDFEGKVYSLSSIEWTEMTLNPVTG